MNEPPREQSLIASNAHATKLQAKDLLQPPTVIPEQRLTKAPFAPEYCDEEAYAEDEPEASHSETSSKKRLRHLVIPKAEPIPWYRFLYMTVLVAIPTATYIVFFTALGWGERSFNFMSKQYGEEYTGVVAGATASWFLILYLLDANTWSSHALQGLCGTVFVLGVVLTIILVVADYPFGPICVFAAVTPLWLLTIISIGRQGAAMQHRTKEYVQSLSGPLFFVSVMTAFAFIVWVFVGDSHAFNEDTKAVFSQVTLCSADLETYPECSSHYVKATERPTFASPMVDLDWNETGRRLHQVPSHRTSNGLVEPTTQVELDSQISAMQVDEDESVYDGYGLVEPTQVELGSQILAIEVDEEEKEASATGTQGSTQNLTTQQLQEQHRWSIKNNMFLGQDTGVCFDTVISPPSIQLQAGCDPSCPRDVYKSCTGSLLLWAGPLLCSMVLFFLSFFCTFLKGDDVEKDIINFGKLWMFLLLSVWITVSLAGVGAGISTVLAAMTLSSFVGAIFFVTMTRPKEDSKEKAWLLWDKFEAKCGGYLNVARAIFLVFCSPLMIAYFCLAVINQSVRKLGLPCSKKMKTPEERADFLTKRARLQINDILSWDRTKVLIYGVYVGLTYLIMSVVISKFAYLIMTLLVEALDGVNLGLVTVILLAFGLSFFLNPFLPGPPVYTMYGLVLMATGQDVLGIYGALAYAIGLSLVVKLLACAMQQKLIGENLAKYVSVRKLVGINSGLIKATRLILVQPGLKLDKVSILVGGPDWPTSVLCGILHLDLLPILVGTIPILVICGPTSLIGSFLYMADQRGVDGELLYPSAASLAALSTALAAAVCLAVPITAAYYLEQKMAEAADEIEAMPIDKEVEELEQAEIEYNKCYEKATKWEALPSVAKLIIYVAFTLMVFSVYIVLIVPKRCFSDYGLTSTVKDDLDGDWTNLVKPFGWISIALFLVSWGIVIAFTSWASKKSKVLVASQPGSEPGLVGSVLKRNGDVERRCAEALHAFLESTSKPNEAFRFSSSMAHSQQSQCLGDQGNVQPHYTNNQRKALECPSTIHTPASVPISKGSISFTNKKPTSVQMRCAEALHAYLESTSTPDEASRFSSSMPSRQHSHCSDNKASVQTLDTNNQREALTCPMHIPVPLGEPVPMSSVSLADKKPTSVQKRCAENLHAYLESTSKPNEASRFGSSMPHSHQSQCLDNQASVQPLDTNIQHKALKCPTPIHVPASDPAPMRSVPPTSKTLSSVQKRCAANLHAFLESKQ